MTEEHANKGVSLRWAAAFGALATVITGGLLAYRDGSVLTALVVAPLAAGLIGSSLRKTWGVFATIGGATLLLVAFGVGEVPAWAAMIAVGGLAVMTPALLQTFRFDAAAAAAWMTLAGLSGGGAALAWNELDVAEAPMAPDLQKPVAPEVSWDYRVRWRTERAERRPCRYRR